MRKFLLGIAAVGTLMLFLGTPGAHAGTQASIGSVSVSPITSITLGQAKSVSVSVQTSNFPSSLCVLLTVDASKLPGGTTATFTSSNILCGSQRTATVALNPQMPPAGASVSLGDPYALSIVARASDSDGGVNESINSTEGHASFLYVPPVSIVSVFPAGNGLIFSSFGNSISVSESAFSAPVFIQVKRQSSTLAPTKQSDFSFTNLTDGVSVLMEPYTSASSWPTAPFSLSSCGGTTDCFKMQLVGAPHIPAMARGGATLTVSNTLMNATVSGFKSVAATFSHTVRNGAAQTGATLYPNPQTLLGSGYDAQFSLKLPSNPSQIWTNSSCKYESQVGQWQGYCAARITPYSDQVMLRTLGSGWKVSNNGTNVTITPVQVQGGGTFNTTVPVDVVYCIKGSYTPCSIIGQTTLQAAISIPSLNIAPSPAQVYAGHSIAFKLTNNGSDVTTQADWSSQNYSIAQIAGADKNVFRGVWTNGVTTSKNTSITATFNGASATSALTVNPMYYFVSAVPTGNSKGMLYTFRTLDGAKITKVTSNPDGNSKLDIVLRTDTSTLYDNSSPKNLLREYFITVTPKNGSITGSFPLYVHFIPKQ